MNNQGGRPRHQNGQLIDRGNCWQGRWREDVPQSDGTVKRVHKREVIAPKEGVSRSMAQQILSDRLRKINGETDAARRLNWLNTFEVQLCDPCRQRLLAALQGGPENSGARRT